MPGFFKIFFWPGTLLDVYLVDLCNKKFSIFGLNEIKRFLVLDPQNLTFSVILHKKCLHTGHFIIVKFSQEFKKVDLVKL